MQVALGSWNEDICVERGGPDKAPVFGGANPASVPSHIRHQVCAQKVHAHKMQSALGPYMYLSSISLVPEHPSLSSIIAQLEGFMSHGHVTYMHKPCCFVKPCICKAAIVLVLQHAAHQ